MLRLLVVRAPGSAAMALSRSPGCHPVLVSIPLSILTCCWQQRQGGRGGGKSTRHVAQHTPNWHAGVSAATSRVGHWDRTAQRRHSLLSHSASYLIRGENDWRENEQLDCQQGVALCSPGACHCCCRPAQANPLACTPSCGVLAHLLEGKYLVSAIKLFQPVQLASHVDIQRLSTPPVRLRGSSTSTAALAAPPACWLLLLPLWLLLLLLQLHLQTNPQQPLGPDPLLV